MKMDTIVKVQEKTIFNEKNRKKRIAFAKMHKNNDEPFWNTVLFSDESKFNIFGYDGRVEVWRKPNTEMDVKNLTPTIKHDGGHVMVSGCMAAPGTGNLVFYNG